MAHAQSKCLAPAICFDMKRQFEKSKHDPTDRKKFSKLVSMAWRASEKRCRIRGVIPLVASYAVCYDQGHTEKNGRIDQRFKGPFSDDEVFEWFVYISKSKFTEGVDFIWSDLFISTLDGGWAETFLLPDDE